MSSSTTTTTTPLFPGGGSGGTHPQDAPAGGGGSYTPVLVVLGVIAALMVISCVVGQVCTKRHLRPRRRRDRVAYYDDGDDTEGGLGHGHPPYGVARMEAPAPSAATVEARPAGDGAAAVHQTTAHAP